MGYKGTPYKTNFKHLSEKLDFAKKQDLKEVYDRIFKGSMPALYETEQDTELFYSSYVNTYLQRDIKYLAQIQYSQTLWFLLILLMLNKFKWLDYEQIIG